MKKNIGKADRTIRVVAAIAIAVLYSSDLIHGTLAAVLLVLAGVLLLTAFVRFCPLYAIFGATTPKK